MSLNADQPKTPASGVPSRVAEQHADPDPMPKHEVELCAALNEIELLKVALHNAQAEIEELRGQQTYTATRIEPPTGVELIAKERARQISQEGWTPEHDDKYESGQLAKAAACYSIPNVLEYLPSGGMSLLMRIWPGKMQNWKPTPNNRIRELTKAGALIAAEIDRLLRKGEKGPTHA